MSEKTFSNGKKSNDAMKTFGTSLGAGVIGGVTAGLLTPIQTFPQSSEIENVEELEKMEDIEVIETVPVDTTEEDIAPSSPSVDINITVNVNNAPEEDPILIEEPAPDDGYMEVAANVDDSMSFSQAFAAARTEVGPGGLFIWHGNTYGTYYADEWNNMSEEDKEQYWADVHHTTAHLNELNMEEEPALEPEDDDSTYALESDDPTLDSEEDENWDDGTDDNPDVDLLASNFTDPDIPIDNHMDMTAFA